VLVWTPIDGQYSISQMDIGEVPTIFMAFNSAIRISLLCDPSGAENDAFGVHLLDEVDFLLVSFGDDCDILLSGFSYSMGVADGVEASIPCIKEVLFSAGSGNAASGSREGCSSV
jgi:hypothetical protein